MTISPSDNLLAFSTHRSCVFVISFVVLFSIFLAANMSVRAQVDDTTAPPPLRMISKEDRNKLDAKSSPKDRTKLSLEMMETRLAAAEKLNSDKNFRHAYGELGIFNGLLNDLLGYLERTNNRGTKVLDEFKRMEIALRRFGSRIEGIRRELPFEFDEYVKDLLQEVRNARSRAVEHFFDKTVSPDG